MISKSLSAAPVIAYCLDFFSLYFGNFLRASVELCYIAFDLQDEEAFSQQFLGLLLSPDMESVHEQAHKPTSPQAHKHWLSKFSLFASYLVMDKDSSKDEKSFGIRIWRFCALVLLFVGVVSKLLFPEPIVVPLTYSDVRLFAILAESFLLIWLLFGTATQSLRTVTGLCFLSFAFYSMWSWLRGAVTCACFGSVAQVPPLLMVFVDFFIATLAIGFPNLAIPCSLDAFDFCRIGARRIILGSFFVIGIGSLICGSPLKFGDRLLGKAMTTTVPYVAMGTVPVNATRTVRFELRNWTAAPIRIVGVRNAYGFVVLDELPVTVAAHQSIPFSVDLKTNSFKSSGLFDIQFQLLLDRPSFPIHLRISAFVDATRTENSNHLVASDGGLK